MTPNTHTQEFSVGLDHCRHRPQTDDEGCDQQAPYQSKPPRRFTVAMKLLRLLPYRLYFPLVARLTRR